MQRTQLVNIGVAPFREGGSSESARCNLNTAVRVQR